MEKETPTEFRRFYGVKGFDSRQNDIIYCSPLEHKEPDDPSAEQCVVYFGGDIQDLPEIMKGHRDNVRHLEWNLEATVSILRSHFPKSHILVVRPSRMELRTFSCFDNFVHSGNMGIPEHTGMYNSLRHLMCLLSSLSDTLNETHSSTKKDSSESVDKVASKLDLVHSDLSIIGFSKGCIVLNQFVREFHYAETLPNDNQDVLESLRQVKKMYWLDGGHAGGKDTWPTNKGLLDTLTSLGISVEAHVTPYQIRDDRRPWIAREEKIFSDTLKNNEANFFRKVHFEDRAISVENHFLLLKEFVNKENDASS